MKLFTRKPIEVLLAQATEQGEHTLKRGLGPVGLTALGVGSIIGAGIFVLTGQAAAQHAGPGIVLSFVIAGIVCAFAALCYAELASMIPVSGSAYTYAYATLGEFFAWVIAWDLIIEYLLAGSTVAAGWSGYFVGLVDDVATYIGVIADGHHLIPPEWTSAPFRGEGGKILLNQVAVSEGSSQTVQAILNLPAMAIIALVTGVLIMGVTESALFNNLIVVLKVSVVVLVIVFGFMFVDAANWQPLVPDRTVDPGSGEARYGLAGVFAAAGVIFFAYIGFETVSTAGQEARNPQVTMPIGILASLAICTVLYILMSLVITGLAPYTMLDVPAPVYTAVDHIGPQLAWLKPVVTIGATVGLASTIMALLYGQSRIFYAMGRDGLLPGLFCKVHPRRRSPWAGTLITGLFAALVAGLFPIGILGELVSMGTLLAFAVICGGVFYLRMKHPEVPRAFKVPVWPVTSLLGVASCLYLIFSLPSETWWRLVIWMAIGLVIYFAYSHRHARIHEARTAPAE